MSLGSFSTHWFLVWWFNNNQSWGKKWFRFVDIMFYTENDSRTKHHYLFFFFFFIYFYILFTNFFRVLFLLLLHTSISQKLKGTNLYVFYWNKYHPCLCNKMWITIMWVGRIPSPPPSKLSHICDCHVHCILDLALTVVCLHVDPLFPNCHKFVTLPATWQPL